MEASQLYAVAPPLMRDQVYHPNIDIEGKICLNILREDWKPVLSISSVIYGLQFLFLVCALAGSPC
jgi:ubiquitin-conjugating enzyme E2 M